jgi:hypothetical protein
MAARATARREAREAAESEYERRCDPHAGHHGHLIGAGVYCSCGEPHGVTCVVFPGGTDEELRALYGVLRCRMCGQRGAALLAGDGWEPAPYPPEGVYEAIAGLLGDLMWEKARPPWMSRQPSP